MIKQWALFFGFLLISLFQLACKQDIHEIYFLPENYRGHVFVFHNIPEGQKLISPYKNVFIYNVPLDGVLILSDPSPYGYGTLEFYYKDSNRKVVVGGPDWNSTSNEPFILGTGVFNHSVDGAGSKGVVGSHFFVGTYGQFKEARPYYELMEQTKAKLSNLKKSDAN